MRAMATGVAVAAALTSAGACGSRDDHAVRSGGTPSPDQPSAAAFVGRTVCAGCHAATDSLWTGSHHDLAMAEAEGDVVLGDFDDATFTHRGVTTTFFTRDGWPRVRTAGPDGDPREYGIAHTFGWAPLQQYLVPVGDGRLQVLGVAWDSRPASEGGQRWFQLHPDAYRPSLLREDLYHPDGQILDEVYVYGSFLQSRMYLAGVTCSDCHEPHSLTLRAEGNALCTRCHRPETYDAPSHHFHRPGSAGARCVECHMPATTYMEVDPRRDHSLRAPRPDLAVKVGTPDACTSCHEGRSAPWAAVAVEEWHGPADDRAPHFAEAFAAGRAGNPEAWPDLLAIAFDPARPGIVRATALSLLAGYPRTAPADAVRAGLADDDPLVQLAALELVAPLGTGSTVPTGAALVSRAVVALSTRLLEDSLRAVRVEAARVLSAVPPALLTAEQTTALERAAAEYEQAQLVNADHPASWVNVGDLRARRGRAAEAERAYRTALSLDPSHAAAHLNLADLQRALGRDDLAERTLLLGLDGHRSEPPELLHALGLLRVRQGRLDEAVDLLGRAAAGRPDDARFAYVYGVAVASAGDTAGGIEILEEALARHPWERDVLAALAAYHRDLGDAATALGYAERLLEVVPEDEGVRGLISSLAREVGRAGR